MMDKNIPNGLSMSTPRILRLIDFFHFCSAKSQSDLQRHYKTHGKAIYRCEEDGCTFAAKSLPAFNMHWENAHNSVKVQKYVCHVCEKKFLRGYYLTKHLIGIHKLQWPSGHSRFR